MPYPYTRRRRRRRALAYAACIVVGLAVGFGGSVLEPGPWFGPADAFERVERAPAPREVLCVAGDCAYVAEALEVGADERVVVVLWLRGRSGRQAWHVTDCNSGDGLMFALDDERQRRRWRRGGEGILDRIAEAACGPAKGA